MLILLILLLVYQTSDAQTWQEIEMNFAPGDTLINRSAIAIATKNIAWVLIKSNADTSVSYSHSNKIMKTANGFKSWVMQKYLNDTFNPHELFTTDSLHCWIYNLEGKLIFTTDGGTNWEETYITGAPSTYPYNFYNIYFFNNLEGIILNSFNPWFTNNGGKSWTEGESSRVFLNPMDITFTSRNDGWVVSEATPYSTDAGYIANTTNGGNTWKYQDSITMKMFAVDFIDSVNGFAVGTNWNNSTGFIYSTTDGGENWYHSQFLKSGAFWDIGFLDDKNGWVTGTGKILNTTDGGNTWETQLKDMPFIMRKLIILKKEKAAYVFGDSDYRSPFVLLFSDLKGVTEVLENEKNIPKEFQLMQNYPNPFNPITSIKYQLSRSTFVKLSVYDLLGREIEVLVNEEKVAGTYNVNWNAVRFSSGVYITKLEAGNFTAFIKMILLK